MSGGTVVPMAILFLGEFLASLSARGELHAMNSSCWSGPPIWDSKAASDHRAFKNDVPQRVLELEPHKVCSAWRIRAIVDISNWELTEDRTFMCNQVEHNLGLNSYSKRNCKSVLCSI
eukprot:5490667-Amphidinium_carterae.1